MNLSPKQEARLALTPPAEKAKLKAQYKEQRAQNAQAKKKAQAPRQQQQQPPQRALARTTTQVPMSYKYAFDGFDKRHLPLDEVTSPYTTSNFDTIMEFQSKHNVGQVIVVCQRSLYSQETYVGPDTDYIAMMYDDTETIDGSIPTTLTARAPIVNAPDRAETKTDFSVRGRLHNLSARLECLGTNTGLYPPGSVYIGKVPCIETGAHSEAAKESLTVKQAWADDSIAVGYLKSYPAAYLVSSPVVVHSTIAENVAYKSWNDFAVPATTTDLGSMGFKTALEPIILYIPKCGAAGTVVDYRLILGQQWCSRHPHDIIVRSTQKQHGSTPPDMWHKVVAAAKDAGPKLLEQAASSALEYGAARMRAAAPVAAEFPALAGML